MKYQTRTPSFNTQHIAYSKALRHRNGCPSGNRWEVRLAQFPHRQASVAPAPCQLPVWSSAMTCTFNPQRYARAGEHFRTRNLPGDDFDWRVKAMPGGFCHDPLVGRGYSRTQRHDAGTGGALALVRELLVSALCLRSPTRPFSRRRAGFDPGVLRPVVGSQLGRPR